MTTKTNTPNYHQILCTKSLEELANRFNQAAEDQAFNHANDIYDALYARVYRLENPNDVWFPGEARDSRYIQITHHHIDSAR